ncbi:hypothetical protein Q4Q39_15840 [Flavivirga amylovorans]|uniref:Lipoprotein n=1 Tax=Flavivirga amylovorans TaxID=870486 RepID=A0ABT8X5C5_9FLAO|nr:hypothetical protein [Flavivirga amylovorans]MDO5988883.1 hypothetical protein [Flavivirga amylovorans]
MIKSIKFIGIFFICIQFFNCNNRKVNKVSSEELSNASMSSKEDFAYFYSSLEDTLELNKEIEVELRLFHVLSDTIMNPKTNRKIGEACVLFSRDNKIDFSSELFKDKCDTIFAPVKRIKDTIKFSFSYTPSKLGENRFLVKFIEKNYFMPKKDSIRLVTKSFFLEEGFVVVE